MKMKTKNESLMHRVMRNENFSAEQFATNRIKIGKLENEIDELKFCVYSLMFLITVSLMAYAFS